METHSHQHHHHHEPAADNGEAAMAELLDLDAEVLHEYLSEVTAWIRDLAGDPPPRRILDLGSGTGAGTFALLERFGQAEATALDSSAPMLHHLKEKAGALGLADRVRTVQVDLDEAFPDVDPADLVWASASLHHLADPDRVLADVFAALRPGGLLVAAELDSFPRFLPHDLGIGRPGLEARCNAVMDEKRAAHLPHINANWGSLLTKAGFTVEGERAFDIELTPPLPAATGRYAAATLGRIRTHLGDELNADDLATLDTLLNSDGPEGLLQRDDLTVRTKRPVWVAKRP